MFSNRKINISFSLLILLFGVSTFYYQPHLGGFGLVVPFNIAAWLMASLFMFSVIFHKVATQTLSYSPIFIALFVFPFTIILIGLFSDVSLASEQVFRLLTVVGGFIFLLALLQLKLSNKQVELILVTIIISALLQGLIAIVQITDTVTLSWLPASNQHLPVGIFQQVNVLASYCATGFISILFLLTRPSFKSSYLLTKILFVVTAGVLSYVIISSGSRVGLISIVLASCLILASRKIHLLKQKKMLLFIFTAVVVAILLAGQSGLSQVLNKTNKMTTQEYAAVRPVMYAVSLDLIKNKPLSGYGIGSFPNVWAKQVALFSKENPTANVPQFTSNHPHNETLLWMVEGGVVALLGIVIIFIIVCWSLYSIGWSRGGAYAALLLPITLHSQVELPFYNSSIHWFLWLFILFIVLRHTIVLKMIEMSSAIKTVAQIFLVLSGLAIVGSLVHAEQSRAELYKYATGQAADIQLALNDLYFNNMAEKYVMTNVLYAAGQQGNRPQVLAVINWAEQSLSRNPQLGMFLVLTDAYGFVDDKINRCRIVQYGLTIYTKNKPLQDVANSNGCNNIRENFQ